MKTKMYISCILALMITAAAWADEPLAAPKGPESPQKGATASLSGNEADQFMDLTGWSDVKFDKLFTYAGFAQQEVAPKYALDLGAAFKAGPVYIGAWYQGNLGKVAINRNSKQVTTEISESVLHSGTLDRQYVQAHKLLTNRMKLTITLPYSLVLATSGYASAMHGAEKISPVPLSAILNRPTAKLLI